MPKRTSLGIEKVDNNDNIDKGDQNLISDQNKISPVTTIDNNNINSSRNIKDDNNSIDNKKLVKNTKLVKSSSTVNKFSDKSSQKHVKMEISPQSMIDSNNDDNNNNNLTTNDIKENNTTNLNINNHSFVHTQKIKSSNPPKVIMLPDSLQQNGSSQKRRRVVRACDRCRKLKIKCSGDLPCIHCTVYNYECTYDQPNRSKKKNNNNNNNNTISNKQPTPSSAVQNENKNSTKKLQNSNSNNSMDRFNSSTVSILASSNPELFSKLTDRLKLYDDILHKLLPEIKLTDLNDNPKPINPMKLMSALNKLKEMGKSITKSSSKQIAKMYESLPEMPLPNLPITKLPPNTSKTNQLNNTFQSNLSNNNNNNNSGSGNSNNITNIVNNNQIPLNNTPNNPNINNVNQFQGIDGSLESSLGKEIKIILPSREVALDLITKTWENACVLFRFYHRVAFIEDLNELYDTDPNQYTNKQQRFLPLVYSVMACGALFYKSDENTNHSRLDDLQNSDNNSNSNNSNSNSNSHTPNSFSNNFIQRKDFEDEGYKYFIAARKLIDITDTRDTYGIQTIVMLIIFLQCSARLSTCYAYIGIALRAALREGLHRKLDYPFNPIELEIRKRLFWTIYKMDIYVNTMLGLPRTISSDDFDQDMPIELDDENITVNGYRWDRQGDRLSSSGIANAHTRLIFIMKEVVTKLYPIKPKKLPTINNGVNINSHNRSKSNNSNLNENIIDHSGNTNNTNNRDNIDLNNSNNNNDNNTTNNNNNNNRSDLMRNNFVYDLELKLQDWMNSLPLELKPGVEPPGQYLKANRLLHISYLHVKIILYRPFIHYISANVRSSSLNDLTCIEKAKNCINVARIVVKLAEDMINKNMLSGSYWFSIYTIFFSVACLVYYVHFATPINRDGQPDLEYIAIKKDAENGKRVLDILKDSSMAARRTYNILNALFEQLNRKTARSGVNNNTNTNNSNNGSNKNNNPDYVPPHMGSSKYKQHQEQFLHQDGNPQNVYQHQHQYSNSSINSQNIDTQMNSNNNVTDNNFVDNSNIERRGVNFNQYNNTNRLASSMQSPIQSQNQLQNSIQNHNRNRSRSQNRSSPLSSQLQMPQQIFNENLLNKTSISNQNQPTILPYQNYNFNNNNNNNNDQLSDNSNNTPDLTSGVFNDITEYKYVPGPMDQMDMKIFGRFLPPYMLSNKTDNVKKDNFNFNNDGSINNINNIDTMKKNENSEINIETIENPTYNTNNNNNRNLNSKYPTNNEINIDTGIEPNANSLSVENVNKKDVKKNKKAINRKSKNNNKLAERDVNQVKDGNENNGDNDNDNDKLTKQSLEGEVFQPSLGLFTFVKNEDNMNEDDTNNNTNNNNAKFDGEAIRDIDNAITNSNSIIDNTLDNGTRGYSENNWIENDLLETTNDFFNQVTTANAIPSGLSTVFQSESDKNGNTINTINNINGIPFDDGSNSGVTSGGENSGIENNNNNNKLNSNIELPSRFTSNEGIGMLDELLFGSGWDSANAANDAKNDDKNNKDVK